MHWARHSVGGAEGAAWHFLDLTDQAQEIPACEANTLIQTASLWLLLGLLQTVSMPQVDVDALTHQHLLRSLDALMDHQEAVDDVVVNLMRPFVHKDLSLVFFDLTTTRAAGLSEQVGDASHYGMTKEGLIARQFTLGVV